jgi:Endonuclease-reverse transcriptase
MKQKAAASKVMATGDFNFPGINWDTYDSDRDGESFRDLIMDNFMIQHGHEPTRQHNILDLVITSEDVMIDNTLVQDHLGTSDHNVLVWDLIHCINIKQYNIECRSLARGNYNTTKVCLQQVDWDQELWDLNVEEIWQNLCKMIQIVIPRYVPLERKKYKKYPKWMNKAARVSRKLKFFMWQRPKQSKSYNDLVEYRVVLFVLFCHSIIWRQYSNSIRIFGSVAVAFRK